MAWKKQRKKARTSKKRPAGGRWFLFLALFLVAAGLLYWQRGDLVSGLRVHGQSLMGTPEIADVAALTLAAELSPGVARVQGIPDYEGRVRVHSGQGMLTCFRMVGFENRIFVCTDGRLQEPEEVEDVLRELHFSGYLQSLAGSRLEEALTRQFVRERGIRPAPGAWILLTGGMEGPSLLKTVLLIGCLLLCILLLIGFIVSLRV